MSGGGIEKELLKWLELARRSGKRGWVLVRDGKILGVFKDRKDAIVAAKEPGIYLLAFVD
ncbi:MAG: hypothetical protein ACP5J0_03940 [Pyrobaculum sp.]|jgi:hypothetical protein